MSISLQQFDRNLEDVDRLLEIHRAVSGSGPGRRHRVEMLNKSAIVLTAAYWEAYLEDFIVEVAHLKSEDYEECDRVENSVIQSVNRRYRVKDQNYWDLIICDWRKLLRDHAESCAKDRHYFSTPITENINRIFFRCFGCGSNFR